VLGAFSEHDAGTRDVTGDRTAANNLHPLFAVNGTVDRARHEDRSCRKGPFDRPTRSYGQISLDDNLAPNAPG